MSEDERNNMLELLISYEYSDLNDLRSFDGKLTSKKRTREITFDFDNEDNDEMYNLNFGNQKYSLFSNSNVKSKASTTAATQSKEESDNEEEEFENEFLNVFSNKRRNSYEENILLLYMTDNLLQDKARKRSCSKLKSCDDCEFTVDSLISFYGNDNEMLS